MSAPGAAMFARFAFPPNRLGYCGPGRPEEVFAYGAGLVAPDPGLEQLARAFDGAWPYLELLNRAAAEDDPLSRRVVEAYWLGNDLLAAVDRAAWGDHLTDRFRPRSGARTGLVTGGVGHGAVPNHAYHVFCVYPWIGLLREGRAGTEPLRIMDQCRIRLGTVSRLDGTQATVVSRPLTWVDNALGLGNPRAETVTCGTGDGTLASGIVPGDAVALHWDWLCQRLTVGQARWLERVTRSQMTVANTYAGVRALA